MDEIITALLKEADKQGLQHVDIIAALIQTLLDWTDLDADDIAQVLEPEHFPI